VTRQGAGLKPGLYKAGRRDGSKNKRPDAALKGGATFKKGAAVLRPYKKIRETVPRHATAWTTRPRETTIHFRRDRRF